MKILHWIQNSAVHTGRLASMYQSLRSGTWLAINRTAHNIDTKVGKHSIKKKHTAVLVYGGSERIRTSETLAGLPDFKSGPIDHSGTLPVL